LLSASAFATAFISDSSNVKTTPVAELVSVSVGYVNVITSALNGQTVYHRIGFDCTTIITDDLISNYIAACRIFAT